MPKESTNEAVADHEPGSGEEQLRSLSRPIASWTYDPSSQIDHVTSESILPHGTHCEVNPLLDVAGSSSTDSDGRLLLLLSNFICGFQDAVPAEPINVVATPRTATPFNVTLTHELATTTASLADVQITVFTWAPDGAAAPNVPFDWRCRVAMQSVIF